ncbi:hypothetical protein B484DRAFT_125509 [Ochromonadaceae sp. CCMP2298]|nr:hypothetical protein B484DRAFT_125509 [Ochromonadaceae sp. CCMP2298]
MSTFSAIGVDPDMLHIPKRGTTHSLLFSPAPTAMGRISLIGRPGAILAHNTHSRDSRDNRDSRGVSGLKQPKSLASALKLPISLPISPFNENYKQVLHKYSAVVARRQRALGNKADIGNNIGNQQQQTADIGHKDIGAKADCSGQAGDLIELSTHRCEASGNTGTLIGGIGIGGTSSGAGRDRVSGLQCQSSHQQQSSSQRQSSLRRPLFPLSASKTSQTWKVGVGSAQKMQRVQRAALAGAGGGFCPVGRDSKDSSSAHVPLSLSPSLPSSLPLPPSLSLDFLLDHLEHADPPHLPLDLPLHPPHLPMDLTLATPMGGRGLRLMGLSDEDRFLVLPAPYPTYPVSATPTPACHAQQQQKERQQDQMQALDARTPAQTSHSSPAAAPAPALAQISPPTLMLAPAPSLAPTLARAPAATSPPGESGATPRSSGSRGSRDSRDSRESRGGSSGSLAFATPLAATSTGTGTATPGTGTRHTTHAGSAGVAEEAVRGGEGGEGGEGGGSSERPWLSSRRDGSSRDSGDSGDSGDSRRDSVVDALVCTASPCSSQACHASPVDACTPTSSSGGGSSRDSPCVYVGSPVDVCDVGAMQQKQTRGGPVTGAAACIPTPVSVSIPASVPIPSFAHAQVLAPIHDPAAPAHATPVSAPPSHIRIPTPTPTPTPSLALQQVTARLAQALATQPSSVPAPAPSSTPTSGGGAAGEEAWLSDALGGPEGSEGAQWEARAGRDRGVSRRQSGSTARVCVSALVRRFQAAGAGAGTESGVGTVRAGAGVGELRLRVPVSAPHTQEHSSPLSLSLSPLLPHTADSSTYSSSGDSGDSGDSGVGSARCSLDLDLRSSSSSTHHNNKSSSSGPDTVEAAVRPLQTPPAPVAAFARAFAPAAAPVPEVPSSCLKRQQRRTQRNAELDLLLGDCDSLLRQLEEAVGDA